MYVRMTTFHAREGVTKDDALAIYEDLLATLRRFDGFEGLTALINPESRQAISLSYWDDQRAAAAAGSAQVEFLMNRVGHLVDRPPEITGFELVAQDMLPNRQEQPA